MDSLTRDTRLRERMGRRAREVAEQHGWGQMAEAYFRLYERLALAPARPAA
jgi:glycosyltransferase involved in cell wall biosynthesis